MHDRPKESDLKAFGALVLDLRERSLRDRNEELRTILSDGEGSPAERLWDAEERVQEIAKVLGWSFALQGAVFHHGE